MSVLDVRLVKSLGSFELDTAWRADAGFTVLFGYSGAGKSLTLSMLTGTVRPDVGRVALGERVLVDSRAGVFVPPQLRRFGYVSQGALLFPHMTAAGNVEYALPGVPRSERRERARSILEELGVAMLAERRPHELSGGQRQRVALARALAAQPELLLLDEPFSALDLPVRAEMREVLQAAQERYGIPVVMVTHDLYEAMYLADTLVVYSGTGVTQVAPPAEVHANPATPEIRRLVRSMELPPSVYDRRRRKLTVVREDMADEAALSA